MLEVEVLPVPVQGQGAAALIASMVRAAAECGRYDVLLLARGGGSLEDLWAFNDESLARAIFAAPIPVVSAIGHETDFSLSDLVADMRAPTIGAAECGDRRVELLPDRLLRNRMEKPFEAARPRAQRGDKAFPPAGPRPRCASSAAATDSPRRRAAADEHGCRLTCETTRRAWHVR